MLIPFTLPPGLNSDDTTFSAEGRWADGNNIRFWQGKPQAIGGNGSATTTLTGAVRAIFQSGLGVAGKVATQTKLYSVGQSFTSNTDVTPAAAQNAAAWSLQPWGSILLAVPRGGTLYEQSGTSQATEVTQAPDQITRMLVTPQRQVLALACNEEVSGTFNGLCIRGCDLEDYTDWTTSSTNNAFEHILDSGGAIKGGDIVGAYVGVWTESVLYIGQFLGDPGQTYRFDPVSDGCGLANSEALCVAHGVAYWVGPDFQLKAWSPGGLPYIIPCPILKDVLTNKIAGANLGVVVRANHRFDEIWIFYADARDSATENSRYIAYSIPESRAAGAPVWFRGQLARTMMFDAGLTASGSSVIMGDSSGNIYRHELDTTAPTSCHIQSADQYFSNSQRRMMVRSFIPDFEYQSGDVALTLTVRDRPQSTAVTKGPYTVTTAMNKKDFRASGKLMSMKFSATAQYFRLGKPVFDAVPMGER